MTGFAYPEMLVEITRLFREGKLEEAADPERGSQRLQHAAAAQASPCGSPHQYPAGIRSASMGRSGRTCPPLLPAAFAEQTRDFDEHFRIREAGHCARPAGQKLL